MRYAVNDFRFDVRVRSVKILEADFGEVRFGWEADFCSRRWVAMEGVAERN